MRTRPHRFTRIALALAVALALLAPLALSACGKRMEKLEPPPGTQEGEYPRKYPRD